MTDVWSLLREVSDLKAELRKCRDELRRHRDRAEYWRARCHAMRQLSQVRAERRYYEKRRETAK